MRLKCDIRIQNLNQNDNHEKCFKECTLSIYRAEESNNSTSNIIITIKPKTSSIELKYQLNKIETYTKFISEGKSTINLIDKNVLLLISNSPPQSLINFISFLKIKFNKNKNISIDFDKENKNEPVANKKENTYINKLLNNAACSYNKNDLRIISPLTNAEISSLMKNSNKTPVRPTNMNESENKKIINRTASSTALKELSSNTNILKTKEIEKEQTVKAPSTGLVKLTSEQINVLKAVKEGKNIFFTGGAGTGKLYLSFFFNE